MRAKKSHMQVWPEQRLTKGSQARSSTYSYVHTP